VGFPTVLVESSAAPSTEYEQATKQSSRSDEGYRQQRQSGEANARRQHDDTSVE
jgi:hypothetical protein